MNEGTVFSLGFALGAIIFIGLSFNVLPNTDQEIIETFADRSKCVETVVGKDTIKRCYELREVK